MDWRLENPTILYKGHNFWKHVPAKISTSKIGMRTTRVRQEDNCYRREALKAAREAGSCARSCAIIGHWTADLSRHAVTDGKCDRNWVSKSQGSEPRSVLAKEISLVRGRLQRLPSSHTARRNDREREKKDEGRNTGQ